MLLVLAPWVCAGAQEVGGTPEASISLERSGELSLLNYNVHGLPPGLGGNRPHWRMRRIAPLLSEYQIVALQETFSVHRALDRQLEFASSVHGTERRCGVPAASGLSTYAKLPIQESFFVPFEHCHGFLAHANDCLANKGLLLTRLELPGTGGNGIDVYNLHLDAGTHPGDIAARAKQVEVLLGAIADHSSSRAVVVVGDVNEAGSGPVTAALTGVGFEESCEHSPCDEGSRIERFYLRSGEDVSLRAVSWAQESVFVDDRGRPLSDHPALALRLGWSIAE